MSVITVTEAQAEAERRWGCRAYALRRADPHRLFFEVGVASIGGTWGRGKNWDAAFLDAERRTNPL